MRSKIMAGVALVVALATFATATAPAHAAIGTDYLNQPRALPYVVDEWFTMANQPPVWAVMAKPFGYYTGLCSLRGYRADAQYLPFLRSTGAVEGFLNFYAMDAGGNCRIDLPITMQYIGMDINYTWAPGQNLNERHWICTVNVQSWNRSTSFGRKDESSCSPPMDAWRTWYLGWYQMEARIYWQFNNDWRANWVTWSWPAALVNPTGCFTGLNDWGQCLRPDGTWS